MEAKSVEQPHRLTLDSRSRLSVTGVLEVESFDETERRKNCESTKYETIHMASHNFHNFTKFDRSNYDLKCKKSDAWFW